MDKNIDFEFGTFFLIVVLCDVQGILSMRGVYDMKIDSQDMSVLLFSNQTEKNLENGEFRSPDTTLSKGTIP